MLAFRLRPRAGEPVFDLVADSARDAIRTHVAHDAALGAELLSVDGVVLARKARVEVDGGWILAWEATAAWPDREAPIDLTRLLGTDEAS